MSRQFAISGTAPSFLAVSQAPNAPTATRAAIDPAKNGSISLKPESASFNDLEPLARPIPVSKEVYSDGAGI